MTLTRVAIHGAAGRMGRRLVALAAADPELALAAALEAPGHLQLGQDAGTAAGVGPLGVPLAAELPESAGPGAAAPVDVVIDFSLPAAVEAITETCRRRRLPLVVATTGLDPQQIERLRDAARDIPLLWSPNMSLAVNLTMKLCEVAGKALAGKDADVEILERHHRYKEDAPSGTALKFGEIIARTMGHTRHRHGRFGRPGKRPHEEIGYHAIRLGDNPGEHTILFGMLGETIELAVRASSRDCYALGALAAAKFLHGKAPDLYGMDDVLGF
jgi:4-hydroxy-tetrahydrodipicolinate reductase